MKNGHKAIIIGAGLGGLVTGSLLARRGWDVYVFEKGRKLGGYAQGFSRGGFRFDASLHSMNGPKNGNTMQRILSECGVLGKVEFIEQKYLYRLISPDFDIRVKGADLDSYIEQITDIFPDEGKIRQFFDEIIKVFNSVCRLDESRLPYFINIILFPILYPKLMRYDRLTVGQFLDRYITDKKVRAIISALWSFFSLPPERLAFSYFFFPFVDFLKNGGFIVKGGSEHLVSALADSIKDSGGSVFVNTPVTRIITKGKRAVGVRTKYGEFYADTIISNISPLILGSMIDDERLRRKCLKLVEGRKIAMSGIQVYLGLDCSLKDIGASSDDYIVIPIENYDTEYQYRKCLEGDIRGAGGGFGITLYSNLDEGSAGRGSTLGLFSLCGNDCWFKLTEKEYQKKKEEASDILIEKAEKLMPGLSSKILVKEVATPRTMQRYTSNPEGSYHGFEQTVKEAGMLRRFPKRYPVKGLYQVGAWTFPGGGYGGVIFSAGQLVKRYFS